MKRAIIKYLASLIFDSRTGVYLILASSILPLKEKYRHMKRAMRVISHTGE
ncbi:hypothetical protein JCM21142_124652 [Saccharicrinis fermentans DSM 9555 = JCM 21142]|uniref:Uncharacterized protein n=1 Tax=Saccharicrinis fermentans DSM 9555 = JCM 21142 TaxID=869213 RepID=W7YEJ3_9BACT|nr:hypothetical protein JCM21142_124652 [Saccharicrinis fermentans DSM 9555 = JCM 21142]